MSQVLQPGAFVRVKASVYDWMGAIVGDPGAGWDVVARAYVR